MPQATVSEEPITCREICTRYKMWIVPPSFGWDLDRNPNANFPPNIDIVLSKPRTQYTYWLVKAHF